MTSVVPSAPWPLSADVRRRIGALEMNLRDLREVLAILVAIVRERRAALVEPHLHPEIALGVGLLTGVGVARVVEAFAIGCPREVAKTGASLHIGDRRLKLLAVEIEDEQRANFGTVLRDGDRDTLAIGGRHEPVDRLVGSAASSRIENEPGGVDLRWSGEGDQLELLLRRIPAEREQLATGDLDPKYRVIGALTYALISACRVSISGSRSRMERA